MRQRLSFWQKFFYGFGDTSNTVSYTVTSLLFLFFLTDVAHLNPALAGVVLLAGKFWDAVTDPLTGYVSDHLHTPLGRRRPFFVGAALPFALTFVLMWVVPQRLSQGGLFVYYAFAYSLHITFFTAYAVPYQALAAELTGDYDERTALNSFRMFFSIVLGLVAAVVPRAIVERFVSAPRGYVAMAWVVAAIIVVPPLVVFVTTREPPLAAVGRRARDSFIAEVRQVLANKPYRSALLMYLFTWSRRSFGLSVAGSSIIFSPVRGLSDADTLEFVIAAPHTGASAIQSSLARIGVYPNPYIGNRLQATRSRPQFVTFTNLPDRAVIQVFNLAGHLVRTLRKESRSQFFDWDLQNEFGLYLGSGMYICRIELPDLNAVRVLKLGVVMSMDEPW